MGMIKEFWREFIAAFRAERQSGEAAKVASREHKDQLRQELRDERESRRVAKLWAKAKTPVEQETARDEFVRYVLHGPESVSDALPSTKDSELNGELMWSRNPGAHESHLVRRYNNPYFPESRRAVTKEALEEAKRVDNDDLGVAEQNFELIQKEIEALPSMSTVGDMHKLRENLDDLIHFSMGVGGPAKSIASSANQLRDLIILTMRETFSDDNESLEAIEIADTHHRDHMSKFNIPFVAQMLRGNSPIPDEDLIPSLMSEEPMTISIFLDIQPEEEKESLKISALMIIKQALNEGYIDPQFEEKLAALSD